MIGWLVMLGMVVVVGLAVAQYLVFEHYQLVSKRVEAAAIAVETVTLTILERQSVAKEAALTARDLSIETVNEVNRKLDLILADGVEQARVNKAVEDANGDYDA